MINWLFSHIQRPERGWDPVPAEHAQQYAQAEWREVNESLLNQLENWIGGFPGKKILDLGGGPGQYTVAFARRGASVTWLDVSATYHDMARHKAVELGVSDKVQFVLGYMDEAPRLLTDQYDLVFNRICWNYGQNDGTFANALYQLVCPGGSGYVDTTNSLFNALQLTAASRFRTWLNAVCAIKVGHPYPPRGRVAKLLLRRPVTRILVEYPSAYSDRVLFQKPRPPE
jgi:2-polyprenyl-3-methyl-5-hydroxy-6-metoxy-1,4-benzoquinol methylase